MAFWRKRYTSKHTGKEIDDAVDAVGQLPENIMANPMTAAGDLIVGGENGAAGKLAAGTSGQVLKIGASGPEWASDAEGMANPMTAAGDLIVGGADGAPGRLAKGTAGQVLKMNAGATAPEWASDAEGMANPMTAQGDMIVGGADGAATRLAAGTAGQVLTMNAGATAPEWKAPSGEALYEHNIRILPGSLIGVIVFNFKIINKSPTPFTAATLYTYLKTNYQYVRDISGYAGTATDTGSAIYLPECFELGGVNNDLQLKGCWITFDTNKQMTNVSTGTIKTFTSSSGLGFNADYVKEIT